MQAALHRLTRQHDIYLDRPVPFAATVRVEPLLQQLRDAVFGEDGRNGGTAETRARLPLSAPALDLYEEIDAWISEVWSQRFQRVPGIELPEAMLREWAEGLTPESLVFYTVKTTVQTTLGHRVETNLETSTVAAFIEHIETLIVTLLERPTVQVPVAGPCPAPGCWATTITRSIGGEDITSHTLAFTREQRSGNTLSVSCLSCNAHWDKSQFREFAEALAMTERGIKPHQIADLRALI